MSCLMPSLDKALRRGVTETTTVLSSDDCSSQTRSSAVWAEMARFPLVQTETSSSHSIKVASSKFRNPDCKMAAAASLSKGQ